MGRAVVHWFDFLPDNLARAEADLLRKNPPALVVWMQLPELAWATHERLFRGGRPCGQREIARALADLRAAGVYTLAEEIPVSEGFSYQLYRRTAVPAAVARLAP